MRDRHRLHRFLLVAVVIGLLSAPTVSLTAQSAAGVAPRELVSAQGAVPRDLGPGDVFSGIPWTGEPGITETVAEIVQRARAEEEPATQTPRVRKPVGVAALVMTFEKYVEENAAATSIELTGAEVAGFEAMFPPDAVAGNRYNESMARLIDTARQPYLAVAFRRF